MAITQEQVLHIAALSRLSLEPGETEKFQRELNAILDYVNTLSEVRTEGVLPRTHAGSGIQAFRADESKPFPDPDGPLKNAPRRDGAFVVVPKVI